MYVVRNINLYFWSIEITFLKCLWNIEDAKHIRIFLYAKHIRFFYLRMKHIWFLGGGYETFSNIILFKEWGCETFLMHPVGGAKHFWGAPSGARNILLKNSIFTPPRYADLKMTRPLWFKNALYTSEITLFVILKYRISSIKPPPSFKPPL